MTDADIRGQALKLLYEHRDEELTFAIGNDGFTIPSEIEPRDWLRACEQLAEKDLIHWNPMYHNSGGRQNLWFGEARIKAAGVDVVEGTAASPMAVHIDQRQNISVHGSQGVQIAGANSQQEQTFTEAFQKLVHDIDASEASPQEKEEAKGMLKKLLESKPIIAVLGPIAAVLLKKFFP